MSIVRVGGEVAKFLIVDDVEILRIALVKLVELAGHEARAVGGWEEAVELTKEWRVDCAVVDYCLPGMNGIELARRLKVICGSRLVVLGLTGCRAEELGSSEVDRWLFKPFGLMDAVRTAEALMAESSKDEPAERTVVDPVPFRCPEDPSEHVWRPVA